MTITTHESQIVVVHTVGDVPGHKTVVMIFVLHCGSKVVVRYVVVN